MSGHIESFLPEAKRPVLLSEQHLVDVSSTRSQIPRWLRPDVFKGCKGLLRALKTLGASGHAAVQALPSAHPGTPPIKPTSLA
jgi:hypothetical protein